MRRGRSPIYDVVLLPKANEISRQLWVIPDYEPDHSYLMGYYDGLLDAGKYIDESDHPHLYIEGWRDGEGDRERWEEEHGFK